MAYIAPIHRPNSVRHALRVNLFPGEDECLILAKTNRLEIWKLEESGTLVHTDTKAINGTISILQKLRPRDAETEIVFVGTDRFHYFTFGWNSVDGKLETIDSFFDIHEKHLRDAQSQDMCAVDPTGRFMAVLLWEGVINVLRMHTVKSKRQNLHWMDQIRVSELFIKCVTFLHVETGHPKIAFLYQSRTDIPDSQLVTYRLTSDDKNTEVSRFEVRDQVDRMETPDPGASILIPVRRGEGDQKRYIIRNASTARAQLGGVIIVGETRLLYYDDAAKKKVEAVLPESSIFVAWAEYDVSRYFLGDDYGVLWLLEILLDGAVVTDLQMTKIGITPRANSLVYMGNNILFVGSHYGDSQVFRVNLGDSNSLETIQTLNNIAPILDLNIMDMGNREGEGQTTNEYSSGQARIVTGSGVYKDGSLRSVRSGVGLDDVGVLADMENVRALFSLQSDGTSKIDTLVVSFLTETRVFTFSPTGEVEEIEEFKGMVFSEQTLLAQNLPNGRLLQITTTSALLVDIDSGVVASIWRPAEGQITNVSANNEWVLLSVDGRIIISLQIQQDLVRVVDNDLEEKDQVACIHLPPEFPSIGVVGFWKSGTISIIDLNTLQSIHGENLRRKDNNASIPRDIALAQVLPTHLAGPTLFVAMEDGYVITFSVSKSDFSLSGRKSVVLGTRQARLQLLPREAGIYNVFATSEHPSLIYGAEGRIVYSAVTADDATCVCLFDSEAFPGSIVVATEKEIKISTIDTERRTHVQTLPTGETIRRIAYSRNERAFGLGCFHREVRDNEEILTNSFKLVDEVVFKQLGSFALDSSPRVEMVEAVIRAELPDSYGELVERFLVGTSYLTYADGSAPDDAIRGRILVLGVDGERSPYLITSRRLKGACRCLNVLGDKIVAALTKTVVMYSYIETTSTTAEMKKIASYRPATYPVDLSIKDNIIAVADVMKSMTLIEYVPPTDGQGAKLVEVARHYQSVWSTAVCHIDQESWLESDTQGNLLVLRQNLAGVTLEDKRRMEVTSEINLGEMVNKIRKVTVDASESAIITPHAFLGTVEGGVYLFGVIAPNYQDLLIRFQTKLAEFVETTGNILFSRYRSFRNEERESEGPFRFIDGEFLERFLDIDEKTQVEICAGLGPDVEAIRNLVEELKRMH
ncbi:mono-functional DNA-alkylating methyl methanesulfonate N-term-domain-containing protein [Annulohypoxylon maeteangense]|uniref:mono-functional DNA-alkylating methyl methanesulfonate N-term-domain-containing protein n=1 Tax=Annulohypoxylon maeteangense TaxID=1927788 RepID=UPI0020085299|nr:mono-functional DNA-alkylating methyl methanesulfonate N-term-domain-containing protein [Annulohypoxylon maeteangense]KAI0890281.1 mono-functional DNA-alkylating methyl methanesulfonate N-term-domain-containing protein [Annulohypoxylon maeteangense]